MPHVDPNAPPETPPVVILQPPPFPPRGPFPGPIGRPGDPRFRIPGSEGDLLQIGVEQFLCRQNPASAACDALAARGLTVDSIIDPVTLVVTEPSAPLAPAPAPPVIGATPPFVPPPSPVGPVLPPMELGLDPITRAVFGIARVVESVFQRGPATREVIQTGGGGAGTLPRRFSRPTVEGDTSADAIAKGG